MPAPNLTPEQLLRLQQMMNPSSGSGWTPEMGLGYAQEGGMNYQPIMNGGAMEGVLSYDPNKTQPGDKFSVYDGSGQFINESQFKDTSGFDPLLGMFLASVLGMGAFLPGGFASGSAAGGAGGAALEAAPGFTPGAALEGAGVSGTGLNLGGGGLGMTGSAGPGLSFSGPTIGMSAASPGASAIGGGLGLSEFAAGTGSLLGPIASGVGSAASTAVLTNAATEAAKGGLLSQALKYGLPIAGALAGSQGSDQSSTTTRDIPDWLKAHYLGENGLLPRAQGLLSQSMSPEAQARTNSVMQAGLGLLNQPRTPRLYGAR